MNKGNPVDLYPEEVRVFLRKWAERGGKIADTVSYRLLGRDLLPAAYRLRRLRCADLTKIETAYASARIVRWPSSGRYGVLVVNYAYGSSRAASFNTWPDAVTWARLLVDGAGETK